MMGALAADHATALHIPRRTAPSRHRRSRSPRLQQLLTRNQHQDSMENRTGRTVKMLGRAQEDHHRALAASQEPPLWERQA